MLSAPEIRRRIRQQRLALSASERDDAGACAVDQLMGSGLLTSARHIATYFPHDGEIDMGSLLDLPINASTTFYFPVLKPGNTPGLWFVPWEPDEPLACNRYGIPEPEFGPHRLRPVWALDLILLPLTAFDADGNRLGMGAGYYDRTLAWRNRRSTWLGPLLLGAAYEFQEVDALEPDPWDVALDGVVTPDGVTPFQGSP